MSETGSEAELTQRKAYYTEKISEYLSHYPDNFEDFVGDEEIINQADQLLTRRLTTGYNFATFEQFPINSKESLIFYGIYAQRADHLGKLLARMENERIIQEDNVKYGIVGTKILGDYGDPEPKVKQIKMEDGSFEPTMESVETIVIFGLTPNLTEENRKRQAARIGAFLLANAPKIEGAYKDPNTRATATAELVEALVVLSEQKFVPAVANVYRFSEGNIIALKQQLPIKLEEELKKVEAEIFNNLINRELYEYLSRYGVGR